MYRCNIISWLVRLPTFEPSVLEPHATFEPGLKGLREPNATFEPRATYESGPKGLREPKATFQPRVLELRATIVQSVCIGVTLSLGWLGSPHSNRVSSNRVRHSNQARRALGSRRPHSNRVSSNRVRQLSKVYV